MTGVQLNVILAIFNMVPLPPLDGSHILQWALPNGLGHTLHPHDGALRRLHPPGARHVRPLFKVIGPFYQAALQLLYGLAR